jgi:hypothetical protein
MVAPREAKVTRAWLIRNTTATAGTRLAVVWGEETRHDEIS